MKKLILLTFIIILTACSLNTTSELRENRTKWEDANITHYRYSVFIGCFCAFRNDMPLTIEVKDGTPVSITTTDGTVVDATHPFYEIYVSYVTIDSIMLNLEADLAGDADEVIVTYDPTYGYPTRVSIDYIKDAVDDELSYEITNFEILK